MGRYIVKADVDNIFGAVNVAKWSNLDNLNDAASPDTTRINAAIAWAEDYVDERLVVGTYKIPFNPVPRTIKDVTARLVGAWLYESRGMDDYEAEQDDPVARNKTEAERTLNKILRGEMSLVADIDGTHTTGPVVFNGTVENYTTWPYQL